ncbi:MAG: pilus assembly protein PilM, partial [Nitrospirota bacterium]|nr:pilus assembly protein PilM [Nitrospirota bacterium]
IEGILKEDVEAVLSTAAEDIIAEITRSFDYYRDTSNYENIDELILSGGVALTSNFSDLLAERTGAEVHIIEPFKNINIPETFDKEYLEKIGPIVTVAIGLALRRVGDK